MTHNPKWTAESASALALDALGFARARRAELRSDVPAMVFFLLDNGAAVPYSVQHMPGAARAGFARETSAAIGAVYVVHIFESWHVSTPTPEALAAYQAHRAAGGAAGTHPDREEVLMCSVDGPGLARMWLCLIRDGLAEEPREVTGPGVTYSGNVANLAGRAGEN